MSTILGTTGVETGFGSNKVLHGVDLNVKEGEISAILGLNGAGKSVTMKTIAGILPLWSGRISFLGKDIIELSAEKRVASGMAHVPQGRQVFPDLTVEQNLRLGAYTLRRRDRPRYDTLLSELLDRFPILAERRAQLAGSMSGGQQATLAVARALINDPKLILVDEASAGLSPVMVQEVGEVLREANSTGVTILMVEQNVSFALKVADSCHIMQSGQIVYEGSVDSLDQERVVEYLGVGRLLGASVGSAAEKRKSRS